MYCGHARLCVCVSVRDRMPTQLHGPGCNLGGVVGDAPSCAPVKVTVSVTSVGDRQ